jgi:hypothetical protein
MDDNTFNDLKLRASIIPTQSGALPGLLAGTAVLLDNERMRRQFGDLERRVHAGNRESVDHRSGRNDDIANAAAGALVLTKQQGFIRVGAIEPHEHIHWHDEDRRSRFRMLRVTEQQALKQKAEGTW